MRRRPHQLSLAATFSLFALAAIFFMPNSASAHSGRTDANGGHNCNVGACAGTYHYHNGGTSNSSNSTNSYISPSINDYLKGDTAGREQASKDASSIREKSTRAGYTDGYSAASNNKLRDYSPRAPASVCDITFTFSASTSESYKSSFGSGWKDACSSIANAEYSRSYGEGYRHGLDEVKTKQKEESKNNGWLWVIGSLFGLILLGSVFSSQKQNR